jgi:two-component system, response regulator YesN
VSGYEDFEYARGALKAGVADYLLKPVDAEHLKSVLAEVSAAVASRLYQDRCRALREIAFCLGVDRPEAERAGARLPEGRYSVAALRFGPPPSRFPAAESVSIPFPAAALARLEALGVWAFPGRGDLPRGGKRRRISSPRLRLHAFRVRRIILRLGRPALGRRPSLDPG